MNSKKKFKEKKEKEKEKEALAQGGRVKVITYSEINYIRNYYYYY
jgi:hypothetical protein